MSKQLLFLIYNTPQENVKVNVAVKDQTIWLSQKAMAELFDCSADSNKEKNTSVIRPISDLSRKVELLFVTLYCPSYCCININRLHN